MVLAALGTFASTGIVFAVVKCERMATQAGSQVKEKKRFEDVEFVNIGLLLFNTHTHTLSLSVFFLPPTESVLRMKYLLQQRRSEDCLGLSFHCVP